jgi:LmbE family N-acetylglucosaminyl deacetylase
MNTEPFSIVAFGAHPDDIEFGCGGVIVRETRAGNRAHLIVCSHGESGTNGTPAERTREAQKAAKLLGATVAFLKLDGDCRLEASPANALAVARILRGLRPAVVLAPTVVPNQHPDHYRLGQIVRDGARLARYGGIKELRRSKPHRLEHLLFYAVTPEGEPQDLPRVLVDISPPEIIAAWTKSMEAHASQLRTRNYVELQLTRARLNGLRAGVRYATALFPNDPPLLDSLQLFGRGTRQF